MKLINTDGMALIGPGSEWFWTALSGLALVITFFAIYRQLRIQRGQGAIEQLDRYVREYTSERMTRFQLDILRALRDGADSAHAPFAAAFTITAFWEKIGSLSRHGHMDVQVIGDVSSDVHVWWLTLAPWVRALRLDRGDPSMCENFEWLDGAIDDIGRRAGEPIEDEAHLAGRLEQRIAHLEGLLRVDEALRTIIVAPPDALTVGQPVPTGAPALPSL